MRRREWEKFRPSFTRRCSCSFCCFLCSNFVKNIFFKTELVAAAERYRILGSHIGLSNFKQNSLVDCFLGRLLGTFLWLRLTRLQAPKLDFVFKIFEKKTTRIQGFSASPLASFTRTLPLK